PRSGAASTWNSTFLHAHGGLVGEALYALANRLVSQLGVDILVVFLLLAGGTLVTGASLPGAIRALARVIVRVTAHVAGALHALAAARKRTFGEAEAAADPARASARLRNRGPGVRVEAPRGFEAAHALDGRAGAPRHRGTKPDRRAPA